ncbi:hypothetical protein [Paenibacillus sinopodophylli]|uniref:hypothetical protein n=1 Tax=Paenibacillus sinopodophylli TaxID=1837342 RepID=UPI00110CD5FE|nr:hypothetical protein [Paenibacillus sinopodophylli]
MIFKKHEPEFSPIDFFITRFFIGDKCLFEQETKVSLPTLITGDAIDIFDESYLIESREFAFNEGAFITVYRIKKVN